MLWGGAYNYLDHEAFWRHMNRVAWRWPENVQVLVRDQEDVRFQVWQIRDGAFVQIVDGGGDL